MPCGKKNIYIVMRLEENRQSLRSGSVCYGYDFKGRRNTQF